jgi:hypothetical protein
MYTTLAEQWERILTEYRGVLFLRAGFRFKESIESLPSSGLRLLKGHTVHSERRMLKKVPQTFSENVLSPWYPGGLLFSLGADEQSEKLLIEGAYREYALWELLLRIGEEDVLPLASDERVYLEALQDLSFYPRLDGYYASVGNPSVLPDRVTEIRKLQYVLIQGVVEKHRNVFERHVTSIMPRFLNECHEHIFAQKQIEHLRESKRMRDKELYRYSKMRAVHLLKKGLRKIGSFGEFLK